MNRNTTGKQKTGTSYEIWRSYDIRGEVTYMCSVLYLLLICLYLNKYIYMYKKVKSIVDRFLLQNKKVGENLYEIVASFFLKET